MLQKSELFKSNEDKSWLRDLFVSDLEKLLNRYNKEDIGVRKISEFINVSDKTLRRVLSCKTKPHLQTILRFYQYFFRTTPQEELSIQHQWIKDHLMNTIEQRFGKVLEQEEKKLESSSVYRKIFILTRLGHVTKKQILRMYGEFGLEIIQSMLECGLLIELRPEEYSCGDKKVTKSPKLLKKIIEELISDHLSEESLSSIGAGNAFYGFHSDINESAYDMILQVLEESKKTIKKIVENPNSKGDKSFFYACAVDQMNFKEAEK